MFFYIYSLLSTLSTGASTGASTGVSTGMAMGRELYNSSLIGKLSWLVRKDFSDDVMLGIILSKNLSVVVATEEITFSILSET